MSPQTEPEMIRQGLLAGMFTREEADAVPDGTGPWKERAMQAGVLLPHQADFLSRHASEAQAAVAGIRIPGFDGLLPLGRGASAAVYRAVRSGTGEVVALKLFDDAHAEGGAASEEALAGQAAPRGVVRVLGRGLLQERPYLVMEYVEGGDLASRMRRSQGRLPLSWSVRLVAEVAETAGDLHARGVLHKDIKPSNILLDAHDGPHLTDLGVGARRETACAYLEKAGTVGYAAPECGVADVPLGPQADVYSLGAVLLELLTGSPSPRDPLAGGASDLPEDLRRILERAGATDPGDRYAEGHALAADLRRFLRGEPISASARGWIAGVSAGMERHPGWTRSVAFAVLGVLLAVLFGAGHRGGDALRMFVKGATCAKNNDPDGAIRCLEDAHRLDPDLTCVTRILVMALNDRGAALMNAGDLRGAGERFDEAIRLDPHQALVFYNRGGVRSRTRDFQGAIADYDEALRLEPRLTHAAEFRAAARAALKDYEGALQDLRDAMQAGLPPADRALAEHFLKEWAAALCDQASALYHAGDLDGARKKYEAVVRALPDWAKGYLSLGFVRFRAKDPEGAIRDLDTALRLDPRLTQAYASRSLARKDCHDYAGAIRDADAALQIEPRNSLALFARAYARAGLKDYDGAIRDMRASIETDPDPAFRTGAEMLMKEWSAAKQGSQKK